MTSIIDRYKKSEFAKIANTNKDKTPLSKNNKTLEKSDSSLEKARGGKLLLKKYSNTSKK
jgi:hypothetical protein